MQDNTIMIASFPEIQHHAGSDVPPPFTANPRGEISGKERGCTNYLGQLMFYVFSVCSCNECGQRCVLFCIRVDEHIMHAFTGVGSRERFRTEVAENHSPIFTKLHSKTGLSQKVEKDL